MIGTIIELIGRTVGRIVLFLTAVFFILKLGQLGVIKNWSWWWVFSPIWITIVILLSALILAGIIDVIRAIFKVVTHAIINSKCFEYLAKKSKTVTTLDIR